MHRHWGCFWARNQCGIDSFSYISQIEPLITVLNEIIKTDEWMKSQIFQLAKETPTSKIPLICCKYIELSHL